MNSAAPARKGEFDLRTPGAAAELESLLAGIDMKAMFATNGPNATGGGGAGG